MNNRLNLGMNATEWKDITESVDITWMKNSAVFVSNLSGRFWVLFFEHEHFPNVEKSLFLNCAKQIYVNTITPSYLVDITARVNMVS